MYFSVKQLYETQLNVKNIPKKHLLCMKAVFIIHFVWLHKLYILMIMFLALQEEAVTVSKQYECMLFVIQAGAISPGYFPIYDRISSHSLSLALSISLIYVLTCRHFLIIPILISATVNEWRDSSCRVWAFGLMWALQRGSLGIVCALTVHYCGYMTF